METAPSRQTLWFGYGSCEDEPFAGNYSSFDEAAIAGFEMLSDAQSIWVCEGRPIQLTNYIHGDGILENISENACEEVGEPVDEWLVNVPNVKVREFEEHIAAWIQANYPPQFWIASNAKQVFRKDYPDVEQFDDLDRVD